MEECHLLIVIFTASGLSVFCPPLQVFSFLASSVIFWATMFESIFGRLHVERHCSFRDLVIRPSGLLQVPSLLNDNSLLKTFLQRSIIWLYAIVMPLYHSYVVTFCIWYLYFVYGKNKQTKTWDPRSTHEKKFHNQQIPTRKNSKPTMVRWHETHETHTELRTLFTCLWHTLRLLLAHSLLAYGTLLTRLCHETHDDTRPNEFSTVI